MTPTTAEGLPDDTQLVDALAGRDGTTRAAAIDRIACRLLEHVSGIEQVETRKTRGPLPPQRIAAISRLAIDHAAGTEERARPVTLSAQLAGAIAIQLADFAELLEDAERRGTPGEAGNGGVAAD